jgi:hypothetical protein
MARPELKASIRRHNVIRKWTQCSGREPSRRLDENDVGAQVGENAPGDAGSAIRQIENAYMREHADS